LLEANQVGVAFSGKCSPDSATHHTVVSCNVYFSVFIHFLFLLLVRSGYLSAKRNIVTLLVSTRPYIFKPENHGKNFKLAAGVTLSRVRSTTSHDKEICPMIWCKILRLDFFCYFYQEKK
jgi:hypothetical protein